MRKGHVLWQNIIFYNSIGLLVKSFGVNFINNLRKNFSYERRFGSFFLVTCRFRVQRSYEKCALIKLMKLMVFLGLCVLTAKLWTNGV